MVKKAWDRMQRWHLLSRYYVNKWHYDGSKWFERFWYGVGSASTPNKVASVPFMVTRAMRLQLEQKGFPSDRITSMTPMQAHQVLTKNIAYARFLEIEKHMPTRAQAQTSSAPHPQPEATATDTSTTATSQADPRADDAIVQPQDQPQQQQDAFSASSSASAGSAIVAVPSKNDTRQEDESAKAS